MSLATVKPGTMAIAFTVEADAKPISVRPVPRYGPGREVIGSSLAYGSTKEGGERIAEWMDEVKRAARRAYQGGPVEGPVAVEMVFFRKRPDNQCGTGRNAGTVKDWAPRYPITYPDVLKLARGVEDAMTGTVYADDAQIVEERTLKLFAAPGTQPRCEVTVWVLDVVQPQALAEIVEAAA